MYCPNCGCMTLGNDCEWCGPPELYKNPKYCTDCGGTTQNKKGETSNGKDSTDKKPAC